MDCGGATDAGSGRGYCIDRLYIYTTLDIIADRSLGCPADAPFTTHFTMIEMNRASFFTHPLFVYLSLHDDRHTLDVRVSFLAPLACLFACRVIPSRITRHTPKERLMNQIPVAAIFTRPQLNWHRRLNVPYTPSHAPALFTYCRVAAVFLRDPSHPPPTF